jgi:hypothetical protein
VTGDQVRVTAGTDTTVPVRLCCRREPILVGPGETVVFPHA